MKFVLGDLSTMPIEGGPAARLAGGLSFERQPTYSPDGKTGERQSDLMVMGVHGRGALDLLVSGRRHTTSFARQRVLFSSSGGRNNTGFLPASRG